MAGKFQPGEAHTVTQASPVDGTIQVLQVTIINEETPGMYRCQTNRGYAVLVPEADLG